MHLVYPPKFYITVVFDFAWDDCNTQEELETMVMQFFFGGGGGSKQGPRACDTIMWHWSADSLFWQLSIDHNMNIHYHILCL